MLSFVIIMKVIVVAVFHFLRQPLGLPSINIGAH